MKLYIIGNGFDLHHGLKTRYSDFHQYVSENNPDLENDFEEYFEFEVDDKYLWKNFERDLAHFNYQAFFDTYNHIDILSETFRPSESYGLEDEIIQETEDFVDRIKLEFQNWLLAIDYSKIHKTVSDTMLSIDENAKFLNFNYTDTLEEIYGIEHDRIVYIHNNANAQFGELIFGHGQEAEDVVAEDELDENGDSNRTLFTDSLNASRSPFFALQKDTVSVIRDNQQFFDQLSTIKEVIVLGHSFGSVDWPYFKAIQRNISDAVWKISHHSDDDRLAIQDALKSCWIADTDVSLIRMTDLLKTVFASD